MKDCKRLGNGFLEEVLHLFLKRGIVGIISFFSLVS